MSEQAALSDPPEGIAWFNSIIDKRGGAIAFDELELEWALGIARDEYQFRMLPGGSLERSRLREQITQRLVQLPPPVARPPPPEPDVSSRYSGLSSDELGGLFSPFFLDIGADPGPVLVLRRACALANVVSARISGGEPGIAAMLRDAVTNAAKAVRNRLGDLFKSGDAAAVNRIDQMIGDIEHDETAHLFDIGDARVPTDSAATEAAKRYQAMVEGREPGESLASS